MNIFQSIGKVISDVKSYPGGLTSLFKESTSPTQKAAAAVGAAAAVTAAGVAIGGPTAAAAVATTASKVGTSIITSISKLSVPKKIAATAATIFGTAVLSKTEKPADVIIESTYKAPGTLWKQGQSIGDLISNPSLEQLQTSGKELFDTAKENKLLAAVEVGTLLYVGGKAVGSIYNTALTRENNKQIQENNNLMKDLTGSDKAAQIIKETSQIIPLATTSAAAPQVINIYTQAQENIPTSSENVPVVAENGVAVATTAKKKAKPKKKAKKKAKAKPKKKRKVYKKKKTTKKKKK